MPIPRLTAIAAAAGFALAAAATADTAVVTLDNGDVIRGTLVTETNDAISVQHPVLGLLTLPREQIQSVQVLPQDAEPDTIARIAADAAAAQAPDDEAAPEPTGIEGDEDGDGVAWNYELGLGLNGSTGSTETTNFRAAAEAERLSERNESLFNLSYFRATDDGDKTADRFEARARNDYLFQDSPWRAFAQGSVVLDEFTEWDQQYRANAGVGYEFVDNDTTLVLGRVGLGAVYEVNADPEELSPEGLLGLDINHQIDERSSINFTTELFPDLDDGGKLRTVTRAEYELQITEGGAMSLRLGAEHRYDIQEQEDKSDLDYFALLVYSF